MLRFLYMLGRVLLCLMVLAASAFPATFAVNANTDSHDANPGDGIAMDAGGRCTFRAAVEEANALSGSDTVTIDPTIGRIALHLGTISFLDDRLVAWGDAATTILDGIGNPLFSPLVLIVADSCEVFGLTIQRSRGHGIIIEGNSNSIGRSDSTGRIVAVGNGLDMADACAILIRGVNASHNRVVNTFVGVNNPGVSIWPNRIGIGLTDSTSLNQIGGATAEGSVLVSGNTECGIRLSTGAHHNTIQNCYVGTDINGGASLPNLGGGILIESGARENTIGDTLAVVACVISGNAKFGVAIEGIDTDSNSIVGNLIGHDFSGRLPLGNDGYGIVIRRGANHTLIGGKDFLAGNAIGSNSLDGIRIEGAGTRYTRVRRNYIGLDVRGSRDRSNGVIEGSGIAIVDGASDNEIGGDTLYRNVVSGNRTIGVLIRGNGTQRNVVAGNFIGTSPTGLNIFGNSVGVKIDSGASRNTIGGSTTLQRNLISGNQSSEYPMGAGVIITGDGTSDNEVIGNYIGLDLTGTRAIRNTIGVIVGDGAFGNRIGGHNDERNVISGNGTGAFSFAIGRGMHLYGQGTSENRICGNWIGCGGDGSTSMPNNGTGISFTEGVNRTMIGAGDSGCQNRIVNNKGFGISFTDSLTKFNTIGTNEITNNDSGAVSVSGGAQQGIRPPVITRATLESVSGQVSPAVSQVDLYLAQPDQTGFGQPITWLAATMVSNSSFEFLNLHLSPGTFLTAIATDLAGNSSACAANFFIDAATAVDEDNSRLPLSLSLEQNYPNPFNGQTKISFVLDHAGWTTVTILNILGQEVVTLLDQTLNSGEYRLAWDSRDKNGQEVASGIYWYRLENGDRSLIRKMVLLK